MSLLRHLCGFISALFLFFLQLHSYMRRIFHGEILSPSLIVRITWSQYVREHIKHERFRRLQNVREVERKMAKIQGVKRSVTYKIETALPICI